MECIVKVFEGVFDGGVCNARGGVGYEYEFFEEGLGFANDWHGEFGCCW